MKLALAGDVRCDVSRFGMPKSDVDLIILAGNMTLFGFDYLNPDSPRALFSGTIRAQMRSVYEWMSHLERYAPLLYCLGDRELNWGESEQITLDSRGNVTTTLESGVGVNVTNTQIDYRGLKIAGVNMSSVPTVKLCLQGESCPPVADRPFITTSSREVEKACYANLPKKLDILISHYPPEGLLGLADDGVQVGSVELRRYILHHQPKLVVCSNNHPCVDFDPETWEEWIGPTKVINTARCWSYVEI